MSETCPVLTRVEREANEILRRTEQAMMASIHAAIEEARRGASEQLQAIGFQERMPAYAYFTAAAHQKLFLFLCGADPETLEGGDPERAARILDNGRNIVSHYWEGKSAETAVTDKTASFMQQDDEPDRFDVAFGAQRLAFKTVIQALVEHAGASDPALRDRITATVEAYIATLNPQSDLERDFAERARTFTEILVTPPGA